VKIDFSIKDSLKECSTKAYGTVPASSMICNFALYNGSNSSKNQDSPIWRGSLPCFSQGWYDPTSKKDIGAVKLFDSILVKSGLTPVGKSFIKLDKQYASALGEYQIQLENIEYDECRGAASDGGPIIERVSQSRVCAMNIAVTDHYMVEKGTTLTSVANDILTKFKSLGGNLVMSQPVPVKGFASKDVNYFMNEFVATSQSKATKSVTSIEGTSLNIPSGLKQIPGQAMYFYDGGDLSIEDSLMNSSKAFTLVVTNGSLEIV
jgi:hypothetical protein